MPTQQINIISEPKNLPATISPSPNGEVKSAWSVFCFFSSEKVFIVIIGITRTVIINIFENKLAISLLFPTMQ